MSKEFDCVDEEWRALCRTLIGVIIDIFGVGCVTVSDVGPRER